MSPQNFYDSRHLTPTGFDRLAQRRRDVGWLEGMIGHEATVVLPVWHGKTLITGPRDGPSVAFVPASEAWWRDRAASISFLGSADGRHFLAADLSGVEDPKTDPDIARHGVFVDLRTMGWLLEQPEGSLAAYARGMKWFHQRHQFCGVCGGSTESAEAGHARRCKDPDCRATVYPRNDPAVIVLVTDGDRCLLGRNASFPGRMHSTLAGFCEAGESLEGTVHREIFEESGIEVADITYHSSQPWPFPQSLMVGFYARAATTEITIDPEELAEASWFSRDYLMSVDRNTPWDSGEFALPRRDSIARRLIEDWLDGSV